MTQILTILIICAAAAGVAYVLWRPQWAVLVVLVMFPLMQLLQSYSSLLNQNKTYLNLAIGFLALFGLVSKALKREPLFPGYGNPATVMVFCLYVWAAVTTIWSPSRDTALDFLIGGLPYFFLLVVITPLLLTDLWDLRRLWVGIMVLGTLISIAISVNPNAVFTGGRLMLEVGFYAGQEGGRLNALATAQLGGMLAIIAALVQFERGGWLLIWVRVAAFVSGLGLAIMSGSRGQVVACVIAGVLFYPMARRIANPKQFFTVAAGLGILIGGTYGVFKLFLGHENVGRWDADFFREGILGRWEGIALLMTEFLNNPGHWLIGLGSNAYATLGRDGYVHNLFAEVLAEQGLIGAAILAVILYYTTRAGYQLWLANRHDPVFRSVVAVLCAVCAYELILTMKQGSFLGFPSGLFWFLILTKVAKHERNQALEWETENQPADAADDWEDEQLAVAQ